MLSGVTILIVEDGDEYLENLSRFVPGPRYLQAHDCDEALAALGREAVDLIYLDMRFDRIARDRLTGDFAAVQQEHNGDASRAWRYLQNNQGLFILDALKRAGHDEMAVILAYDFGNEERRFAHLRKIYPRLAWVPDAVAPEQIADLIEHQLQVGEAS